MDGWWPIGAALAASFPPGLIAAFADWRLTMLVMVLGAARVLGPAQRARVAAVLLRRPRDEAAKVIDDLVDAIGAEPGLRSARSRRDDPRCSAAPRGRNCAALWKFNWKITMAARVLVLRILLVYYLSLTWMPADPDRAGFEE